LTKKREARTKKKHQRKYLERREKERNGQLKSRGLTLYSFEGAIPAKARKAGKAVTLKGFWWE